MSLKPNLRPLPEPDRSDSLGKFLVFVNSHPDLAHVRSILRTGPERQLALFAAFERDVVKGNPAASPPAPADHADLLLCDILEAIDRDPRVKDDGSGYGSNRHLASLQAFGLWRKREPLSRPTALELFTTTFSALMASATTTFPSSAPNNSPLPQVSGPNGEKIDTSAAEAAVTSDSPIAPQVARGTLVITDGSDQLASPEAAISIGIIHHSTHPCGEKSAVARDFVSASQISSADMSSPPTEVPIRPIRRGRPIALDDLAKGKLLGLMSHGLSFRQAAAQLGVHHATILNAMKRDEEFAQQVSEARLDAISQPLLTVIQASRKNWRAAAWLAKFLNDRRTSAYEVTPEERQLSRR